MESVTIQSAESIRSLPNGISYLRNCDTSNMKPIVIQSADSVGSFPTGISYLKKRGTLKFIGQGVDFQVYGDGNDAYVTANIIRPPPQPTTQPVMPELELIRDGDSFILRTTPNAYVEATNLRGEKWTFTSDQAGNIMLSSLPRGVYSITVNGSAPIRAIIGGPLTNGNGPERPLIGSRN